MNPFALAWMEAARDLGIRVVHPFQFTTPTGWKFTTAGVYLPDFGSARGTLLTCRFDSDEICDAAEETDYYRSSLNPHSYEPYSRALYVETLDDWGWYGQGKPPAWYRNN